MLDFRLLPCCQVIAIMCWLTVVDFAFEVQMSFQSQKSLLPQFTNDTHTQTHTHTKSDLTLNISLRLWISIYPQTQIGWNEFDSPHIHTDYFVEIEY